VVNAVHSTGSLRQAAAPTHASQQRASRLARIEDELGWQLNSNAGVFEARVALTGLVLLDSAELSGSAGRDTGVDRGRARPHLLPSSWNSWSNRGDVADLQGLDGDAVAPAAEVSVPSVVSERMLVIAVAAGLVGSIAEGVPHAPAEAPVVCI
jgi:hypothetical protein